MFSLEVLQVETPDICCRSDIQYHLYIQINIISYATRKHRQLYVLCFDLNAVSTIMVRLC